MLNNFAGADKVYMACGYTELRKGVRPELYALSTILFLFAFLLLLVMNRRSDRIAGNHAGIH